MPWLDSYYFYTKVRILIKASITHYVTRSKTNNNGIYLGLRGYIVLCFVSCSNVSGRGWYKYEKAGGRTPTVDPEVTAIIEEHCQKLGIERRSIGSQVRSTDNFFVEKYSKRLSE